MRRSNRRTTCWGLFLFSFSAAVLLLLGLGSSSSSSSLVEATSTRTGANRRAVRKTAKARQHHQQRNLQSGKGGKGGSSGGKGNSSGKDISNNAGLPSGMLATIGAIDAMNYGILQHQNNAKKSSKGSSSGGLYASGNINYGNGGFTTPTTDPVITNPTTGTIIQPNQGGSTEEIISGNVGTDTNAAGSGSGASTEASSPLDTILDSVVSVVNGGGGGGDAHSATQDSNTNTDGAVESSKDDVNVTEDQDSTSTPTTPTVTIPSAGAEQDSISTATPSTPVDTSKGTVIVGDSTGTEGPTDSSTNPSVVPPTNTNPLTNTVVDDSTGIDSPQAPTDPSVIPPTSGTTDESFFDGSTTVPDNQQDVPQEKDEEHISTDQFVYLDDEDGDSSDQSDNANGGEGNDNVVIIMPTPGQDATTSVENSAGIPNFEYGSNINDYSPNQPGKEDEEETEDELKNDSVGFGDTVEELSEESDDDKKGKDKDKPAKGVNVDPNSEEDEESVTPADTQVSDADPNSEEDEESVTPADTQVSDADPNSEEDEESVTPADTQVSDADPNSEEDEESVTPADTQVSDADPNSEEDEESVTPADTQVSDADPNSEEDEESVTPADTQVSDADPNSEEDEESVTPADTQVSDADPNSEEDEESVTPADTQVSDADPNSEEDEESVTPADTQVSDADPNSEEDEESVTPADTQVSDADPNSEEDEESVTPADTQVSDADPNSEEDEESVKPADTQVSETDPSTEEGQSINILPSGDSEPSTVGDNEGSDSQSDVNGDGGDKDISPDTQEEAADGTVISIPPLDQDESIPSDIESEISFPPTGEDLPENEALSPVGDDNDESGRDDGGEIRRLDMPEGLIVSIFLSEEETRRLQASPTDPLKNQEEFEFVLNGMGETEITLQNYLARHLNGYLLRGISGLSFVSIDSISAFLTTKSYQGRPTPAIVVKSIEGTTTYRGVEKPSPRILEANTLGAFNTIEGRNAFINNIKDSDDNILSQTIDVSAEINRGTITPSSDTTSPVANAATQNDTQLRANGGSAARVSGIAIGGLIIVVAMFVVGHKLVHQSKDEIELEDENSLEHKYDLDSIESETAFSSTTVSYHGANTSREKDIASHHRDIMAYDDSASYPEGTMVLSPVAESPIAEEIIDDLVVTKKIQIVAEEPQKEGKVPSPLFRKLYSFSPSTLKRATFDNGLQKEMAATSILGPGRSAYDMSIISPSTSDDTNATPQEQSPDSDCGKSALLLEDGLASRGPDPPTAAELNETVDTSHAVMVYSHSEGTSEEDDQTVPSTIDVDAVDSDEAARRLGLGIRSFSDVKEEDEENRLVVKSSPTPITTPERRAGPSPAKESTDPEQHQKQNVWRQQKSQSTIPYVPRAPITAKNTTANEKGQENKLYDPIFVNGKVQMKERSPPYRQIFRK